MEQQYSTHNTNHSNKIDTFLVFFFFSFSSSTSSISVHRPQFSSSSSIVLGVGHFLLLEILHVQLDGEADELGVLLIGPSRRSSRNSFMSSFK